MSKTINFHFPSRVTSFCLAVWLLPAFVSGVWAQQGGAGNPAQAAATPVANGKSGPSSSATQPELQSKASQTVIDANLPDDPAVNKMLESYSAKVRALEVVIGKLEGELKKGGLGGGSLGNFVTDGMRAQASLQLGQPVDWVVTNSGGLRRASISPGNLHIRDIFELLPFENKLVEVELTGAQLLNVLRVVVASREPQAGALIKYKVDAENKPEFVGASLLGADGKERQIDPGATYRVITIDYLLSVSGGNFAMLQQAKTKKPLGVTIRDAIIEYVRAETAAGRPIQAKLDGRFRRE